MYFFEISGQRHPASPELSLPQGPPGRLHQPKHLGIWASQTAGAVSLPSVSLPCVGESQNHMGYWKNLSASCPAGESLSPAEMCLARTRRMLLPRVHPPTSLPAQCHQHSENWARAGEGSERQSGKAGGAHTGLQHQARHSPHMQGILGGEGGFESVGNETANSTSVSMGRGKK